MRLAVVSPYDLDRPGGVQDQARRIVGWMRQGGHDAWLVGPGTGRPGERSVGPTITVPANRSRAAVALRPSVFRAVAAATEGADIVHLHEPFMPLVGPAGLRLRSVRMVATFHADPGAWVRRWYRWGSPVLRRMLRRVDVITAVSPIAAGAVTGFADPVIVPNGIEVAAFRQVTAPRVASRVAFLGRDEPRKGLDVLLAAWPEVVARVPSAELVVMGASRSMDLRQVRFAGPVGDEEKRATLASAAIYCAPNTSGESFGIVVAEGLAAGCAVVASDLPAFRFVLGDPPAGRLVPPGDVGALARALVELLRHRAEREALAARGAERVLAFDGAAVRDGYLAVYKRALSGSVGQSD